MASAQLTDEELFSELKRFGFTPGPVTENTRPVYLKKLKKFREEQQQRGARPSKIRSGSVVCTAGGGSTTASRPVSHDVTHLSSNRRPGRKSCVLGFSSDESDVETPVKGKALDHRGKANRNPYLHRQPKIRPFTAPNVGRKSQFDAGTTLNINSSTGADGQRSVSVGWEVSARSRPDAKGRHDDEAGDESDCEEESEKNSHCLNGRGASHPDNLSGDYSDSEEEGAGGYGVGKRDGLDPRRGRSIVSFSSHAVDRGSQTGGKNSEVNPLGSLNMVGSRAQDDNEGDMKRGDLDLSGAMMSHRFPRKPIYVSFSGSHGVKAGNNNHVDGKDGTSRSNSNNRFSIGLRPRFSNCNSLSQRYRGNHGLHNPAPNHSFNHTVLKNTLAVPEDDLLQQFKREELPSPGSFSAHYLSMFLLTTACLFFLLLGLMYLRMRGSGSSEVDGVGKYLK